ncbi:hypothetical protein CCM_06047 [Cordyceps militaris CM01]|uniref:Uncharacterized protein n=1 Tax=Cordyceps militaris (strain CM01) TaxID=983644 RepID=G3JIJ2_CORMM|nr:uncharacterized protein CCM_06047 [Cordyceps militaris CM01]EGX91889.1 hypothetical protein CCM_06047 [Cordyceps militaris CM01]
MNTTRYGTPTDRPAAPSRDWQNHPDLAPKRLLNKHVLSDDLVKNHTLTKNILSDDLIKNHTLTKHILSDDLVNNHTLTKHILRDDLSSNHSRMPPFSNLTALHNQTNLSFPSNRSTTIVSLAGTQDPTATPPSVPGDIIMAGSLLGVFLLFLAGIVVADLRAKRRTGELRDDLRGIGQALLALPRLAVSGARKAAAAAVTSRRRKAATAEDVEAQTEKTRASQAIVERLAGKEKTPHGNSSGEGLPQTIVMSLPESIVVSVTEVELSGSDEATTSS